MSLKKTKIGIPTKKRRDMTYMLWLVKNIKPQNPNPLLNNKILRKVTSHLKVDNLLNCRLVCKSWNQIATSIIAKSAFVFFDNEDFDDSYIGVVPFLSSMSQIVSPLITRVYLYDIKLSSSVIIGFFQAYGRLIKDLRMELTPVSRSRSSKKQRTSWNPCNDVVGQVDTMRASDLRNIIMCFVPNLQILELISVPINLIVENIFDDWYKQMYTCVKFKDERIQKSTLGKIQIIPYDIPFGIPIGSPNNGYHKTTHPLVLIMDPAHRGQVCNLRKLQVEVSNMKPRRWEIINDLIWASDNLEEINLSQGVLPMPVLHSLENYGRFSNLKTLILDFIRIPDLELLFKASEKHGLQLRSFECRMSTGNESRARFPCGPMENICIGQFLFPLEKFLQAQSKSLKVLKLHQDLDFQHQPRLENMKAIRELQMAPDACAIPCFLHPFPNVKILSLVGLDMDAEENTWEMLFPLVPPGSFVSKVRELELPLGMKEAAVLTRFQNLFPRITALTMKGLEEPAVITALWRTWPKLTRLHLELKKDFKDQSDRIFTGFNNQIIEDIFYAMGKNTDLLKVLCRIPNLAGMTSLRHLEITLHPNIASQKYSFTNTIVYFGFVHLSQLRTLLVPESLIEDHCIERLKFNLLDIETMDFKHIGDVSRW